MSRFRIVLSLGKHEINPFTADFLPLSGFLSAMLPNAIKLCYKNVSLQLS